MLWLEHARGPIAAARKDLGICRFGNCIFGKFQFWKTPLGSYRLGKYPWEVDALEGALEKVTNILNYTPTGCKDVMIKDCVDHLICFIKRYNFIIKENRGLLVLHLILHWAWSRSTK